MMKTGYADLTSGKQVAFVIKKGALTFDNKIKLFKVYTITVH